MSTCFSSLDTRPYHTSVLISTIIVHVQDANGHQQEAEDAAKVWYQYHEELPVIGLIKISRQVTTEKAT